MNHTNRDIVVEFRLDKNVFMYIVYFGCVLCFADAAAADTNVDNKW